MKYFQLKSLNVKQNHECKSIKAALMYILHGAQFWTENIL